MMKYKGYIGGNIVLDDESGNFHGKVLGLKDVITFHGKNAKELEQAFKDSVDVYLDYCRKRHEKPEKMFTGNIRLRLNPDLHADLVQQASVNGQSLHSLIVEKLKR